MKNIFLSALLCLTFSGCGKDSKVTGMGVIENQTTIEYSGIVLNDRITGQTYDISHLPENQKEIGTIVEYEGSVDTSEALPAGVPRKITLSKFSVIGIEN